MAADELAIPDEKDGSSQPFPAVEFHVHAQARERYELDSRLFALDHNRLVIEFRRIQKLAEQLQQDSAAPEKVQAGLLYGMGLEHLIFFKVIRLYRNQINPRLMENVREALQAAMGPQTLDEVLTRFNSLLPDQGHYEGERILLDEEVDGVLKRDLLIEELTITWLANRNPACEPYSDLFDEAELVDKTKFSQVFQILEDWFQDQPPFGSENLPLLDLLQSPIGHAPESIPDQLEYIREHWGSLLGDHLRDLLRGLDMIREETKQRGLGPGETYVPDFGIGDVEYERYSKDSEWMPRVVMIAKNTLVWLDQLSKQYEREIRTLDQVPDEEIELLAQRGFTALWLIGLWERSDISRTIKHWCGNPDAESSAYSLKGYDIMHQIGGYEAYENLRNRCWQRGVRLASDMVPNHTGLDSPWLKEHADWYVQSEHSPFPSYQFESGDLSQDQEITIQIEDHYFSRDDAAVVFKHYDHRNGQSRFIYHGNDGTSMPWNDTAQLNYLNPEVREAIIQTILHVARQFPIIRFDAAMTLAKRHIHRLWFPEPGSGGDIPSRSNFGLTRDEFDAQIPNEFWREVVDRVAEEVPDTLLLAEAFWMMEGYFVRTLGMHRVYNSAFMNMLKMEENSKFRGMIKATLDFDPRILQRYVNFLSNPDEETAVAQFGKGDKYFGVTTLMITLPGLPMFAHAQVEGFEEKYGMEYRRAYWEETPDQQLVDRHEHEIFPLVKKRYLFAGAENFRLFDFVTNHGVNENVMAYTNRVGDERALVLVNNAYESVSGHINGFIDVTRPEGGSIQGNLLDALDLSGTGVVAFKEQRSGLTFLRTIPRLGQEGFYAALQGYESQVFLDFRVLDKRDAHWRALEQHLNGRGVQDLEEAVFELKRQPVQEAFERLLQPEFIEAARAGSLDEEQLRRLREYHSEFFKVLDSYFETDRLSKAWSARKHYLESMLKISLAMTLKSLLKDIPKDLGSGILAAQVDDKQLRVALYIMGTVELVSVIVSLSGVDPGAKHLKLDAFRSGDFPEIKINDVEIDPEGLTYALMRTDLSSTRTFLKTFEDDWVSGFLQINKHEGTNWYQGEMMEAWLAWLAVAVLTIGEDKTTAFGMLRMAWESHKDSEYSLDKFLGLLKEALELG